jgi:hypothetical protein
MRWRVGLRPTERSLVKTSAKGRGWLIDTVKTPGHIQKFGAPFQNAGATSKRGRFQPLRKNQ